jgi:type I restriction enzyme, S subunit
LRDRWTEVALGDVAAAGPAGTFDPTTTAAVPYIGMEHLGPEQRDIARWGASDGTASSKTQFIAGDVLYGKLRPYLKKVALADKPGVCSTEIIVLRPRDSTVTPEFLYYLCASPRLLAYAINHSAGTRMPRISPTLLLQAKVDLPPVQEQRRIAAIGGAIDDALGYAVQARLALDRLLVASVDQAVRALEEEMTPEMLADVADVRSGLAKGRKPSGEPVSVPFLRAANVQDGWLDLEEIHHIDVSPTDAAKFALAKGDALLVEGSGSPARLGTGWIWDGEVPDCIHQNHVFAVRTGDRLEPRWLAHWITSTRARTYFHSCVKTSSGLATINKQQVACLPVIVPSLEWQRQILAALDAVRDARTQTGQRIVRLRELRSAVMTSLLEGTHEIPSSFDRLLPDTTEAGVLQPTGV